MKELRQEDRRVLIQFLEDEAQDAQKELRLLDFEPVEPEEDRPILKAQAEAIMTVLGSVAAKLRANEDRKVTVHEAQVMYHYCRHLVDFDTARISALTGDIRSAYINRFLPQHQRLLNWVMDAFDLAETRLLEKLLSNAR